MEQPVTPERTPPRRAMRKPSRVLTVADASGSCLRKLRAAVGRVVLLEFARRGSCGERLGMPASSRRARAVSRKGFLSGTPCEPEGLLHGLPLVVVVSRLGRAVLDEDQGSTARERVSWPPAG